MLLHHTQLEGDPMERVSNMSLQEMAPLFAFKLEEAVSALCPAADQETAIRIRITRSISERQEHLLPGARWPAEQVNFAAGMRRLWQHVRSRGCCFGEVLLSNAAAPESLLRCHDSSMGMHVLPAPTNNRLHSTTQSACLNGSQQLQYLT
jgi:hypothetical protein